jgi:hypothetical protein
MTFETYKIIHMIGLALLMIGLAGVLFAFATSKIVPGKVKMLGFAFHGLGLLLIIVSGFGMAARLGIMAGLPGWLYGKLGIWVLMALGASLAKRKANSAGLISILFAALVGVAAWLAITKPF